MRILDKLFSRYALAPGDRSESELAVARAVALRARAEEIRDDASGVATRHRQIQQRNGFGQALTNTYRNP